MPTPEGSTAARDDRSPIDLSAPIDLPALLVALRRSAGLSQERLAEAAGLSSRTVGNLERGRVVPQPLTVERIAAVLGAAASVGTAAADQLTRAAAASTAGPPETTHPLALPATVRSGGGREAELRQLDELATAAVGAQSSTAGPTVVVVYGPAGAGKTDVAVTAAHRAGQRYGVDGLLLDLAGTSRQPLAVGTAIDRLLRALGVPEHRAPLPVLERATLLRSVMSGRRGILVLDDAYAEEQVRPVLPASAGWLTIVTSRSGLAGLFGARWCPLESPPAAVAAGGPAGSDTAYLRLPAAQRQLFRRLALLHPGDHPATVAELLTDLGPAATAHALDGLIEAGLLTDAPQPGSFRLCPTVRRHAAARLRQEENVELWRDTCLRLRRHPDRQQ